MHGPCSDLAEGQVRMAQDVDEAGSRRGSVAPVCSVPVAVAILVKKAKIHRGEQRLCGRTPVFAALQQRDAVKSANGVPRRDRTMQPSGARIMNCGDQLQRESVRICEGNRKRRDADLSRPDFMRNPRVMSPSRYRTCVSTSVSRRAW